MDKSKEKRCTCKNPNWEYENDGNKWCVECGKYLKTELQDTFIIIELRKEVERLKDENIALLGDHKYKTKKVKSQSKLLKEAGEALEAASWYLENDGASANYIEDMEMVKQTLSKLKQHE